MGSELPAFDFLSGNFAGVDYQAIYKLYVRHFEREDGHRRVVIDCHVFGHRKDKCRLSHGRTGCDDDEVGVLPARCHFVEVGKSRLQAAQSVFPVRCDFEYAQSLVDDGVDLREIFLDIPLGNLKQLAFGLLHQVVHVDGGVVGIAQYFSGKAYQFPGQVLLHDDAGVKFDVGGRRYPAGQLGDDIFAPHLFEASVAAQLFAHGEHVDRLLLHGQVDNRLVDELVFVFVEAFGFQYVTDDGVSIFFEHQGPQHGLFEFAGLGL